MQRDVWVRLGRCRHERADTLVARDRQARVGRAVVHKHAPARRRLTVLVVWALGYEEPWVVFTDLPSQHVGPAWCGLRTWIRY